VGTLLTRVIASEAKQSSQSAGRRHVERLDRHAAAPLAMTPGWYALPKSSRLQAEMTLGTRLRLSTAQIPDPLASGGGSGKPESAKGWRSFGRGEGSGIQ